MGEAAPPTEHVLITCPYELPEFVKQSALAKFPDAEVTFNKSVPGVKSPPELFRRATIVVTFNDLPNIEDASNIKFIHTLSAGVDHLVNNPLFKDSHVPFTTSSGIHGPPIAEWVIMNWLVSARKYNALYEAQKAHRWEKNFAWMQETEDQVGKKVGILGYGSIGRQIAVVARAFGMQVYAYTASPRETPESRRDDKYVVPGTGDPDGLIPVSWHHGTSKEAIHEFLSLGLDHLVVSVPLTPQTTHMLGAEEFALLEKNSMSSIAKPFVTNISRGKVLDQDALLEALEAGRLGGAALDVTDPEPLPAEHPLWDVPNVQISPHISGSGRNYFPRSLDIVRINLDRLKEGKGLLNRQKRGNGY